MLSPEIFREQRGIQSCPDRKGKGNRTGSDRAGRIFESLFRQEMIEAFPNQIINIHPSLIPCVSAALAYYGLHVHEGVLARGAKVTGATVHFVDNGMDYRSDYLTEGG